MEKKIEISVRIRPSLPFETNTSSSEIIIQNDENNILLINDTKSFKSSFDKIFSATSNQKEIFNYIKKSISYIKKEISICIITYGQKNSGKTYTMLGGDLNIIDKKPELNLFSKANGIIPNFIIELFSMYNKKISNEIEISCNYIQLINDKIIDLLIDDNDDRKEVIKIKNDKVNGVIIEGAKEIITNNFYNVFQLIELGQQNLLLNNKNNFSYGHTIFIINILNKISNTKTKVKFCDLAGINTSNYYEKNLSKNELKILRYLNSSLSSLKNVLFTISNSFHDNNTFIPYKDSKLTQILKDTFDSKIFIIATISSISKDFNESLNTLLFVKKLQDNVNKHNNENNEEEEQNNQNKINKFKKIEDLKHLIKIRKKKRVSMESEIFDLKKENQALKNYINSNNLNHNISLVNIQKILRENKKLKDELKELTTLNEYNKNNNINSSSAEQKLKKIIPNNKNLNTINIYDDKIAKYKRIYDSADKLPILNASKSARKINLINNTISAMSSSNSCNKIKFKEKKKDRENLFRRNAKLILINSNTSNDNSNNTNSNPPNKLKTINNSRTENKNNINKTEISCLSRYIFNINNNTERKKNVDTFDDYMNIKSFKSKKPTILPLRNLNNFSGKAKIKLLNSQALTENEDEYKDLHYYNVENNSNNQNNKNEQNNNRYKNIENYNNNKQNIYNKQITNDVCKIEQNNGNNNDDEQKEESVKKNGLLQKKKTKTETNDSDNTTTQKLYITAENTNVFDESSLMNVKLNKKRLTSEDIFKLQFQRKKKQQSLDNFTKKNKIKTLHFLKGLSIGENLEIHDGRENSNDPNFKNGFSFINIKNL